MNEHTRPAALDRLRALRREYDDAIAAYEAALMGNTAGLSADELADAAIARDRALIRRQAAASAYWKALDAYDLPDFAVEPI